MADAFQELLMTPSSTSLSDARRTLARSIGLTAFVYGYPLTETYRTCRKQTYNSAEKACKRREMAFCGFPLVYYYRCKKCGETKIYALQCNRNNIADNCAEHGTGNPVSMCQHRYVF